MPSSPCTAGASAAATTATARRIRNDFIKKLSVLKRSIVSRRNEVALRSATSLRRETNIPLFLSRQLVGQRSGVVHLAQRLDDGPRVHGHRPRLLVGVKEVGRQRLDVAVEDQTDHLAGAVDD